MGIGESVAGDPTPELEPGLLATDTLRRAKLLLRRSAQLFGLRVTQDFVECVNCHDRDAKAEEDRRLMLIKDAKNLIAELETAGLSVAAVMALDVPAPSITAAPFRPN